MSDKCTFNVRNDHDHETGMYVGITNAEKEGVALLSPASPTGMYTYNGLPCCYGCYCTLVNSKGDESTFPQEYVVKFSLPDQPPGGYRDTWARERKGPPSLMSPPMTELVIRSKHVCDHEKKYLQRTI